MKRSIPWLAGLLGLAWAFAILATYYLTHKPVTPETAAGLALLVWRLIVALGIVALAGGLGRKIAPFPHLPPMARASSQAILGLGLFSLGFLLLGAIPHSLPWIGYAAPLLLGGLLRRPVRAWLSEWRELDDLWRSGGRLGKSVGMLTGLSLLGSLFVALAPPLRYDALVYHLTMPQAYLRLGSVQYLPWITWTGMPQAGEMLYTWAMALGGAQAATTLSWCFGLLGSLGLLSYLRSKLDARAAWVGLAALLCGYTLAVSPAWGYVDWLALCFGFGALACLDGWLARGEVSDLRLAGFFAGLVFTTKYTGGVLFLAAGGALLWAIWRRKARLLPALLWFGAAALLPTLPWLAKNLITTGNPFYPFFFVSGAMSAERVAEFRMTPGAVRWLDLLFLPIRATYLGSEYSGEYGVSAGPLLLGLGGLAWLGWKAAAQEQRRGLEIPAAISLLGLLIWAVAMQFNSLLVQTRMYFSYFPAFTTLAAYGYWGFAQLRLPGVRLGRIAAALVLIVLGLNALEVTLTTWQMSAPQAALGLVDQQSYLEQNTGWYQRAMRAVRELPQGSRVINIYEPRGLYCSPTCEPDDILDRWMVEHLAHPNADELISTWRSQGYTHLLVYSAGVDYWRTANDPHHTPENLRALDQFLTNLPVQQEFGGVYVLYTIPEAQ